jgi:hypothetical protein
MKQFFPAGLGVASILAIITCSAVHVSSCKSAPAADTTTALALTLQTRTVFLNPLDSGNNAGGSPGGTPKIRLKCHELVCKLLALTAVTLKDSAPGADYAVEIKSLEDIPANSTFRLEFSIVRDSLKRAADTTLKK